MAEAKLPVVSATTTDPRINETMTGHRVTTDATKLNRKSARVAPSHGTGKAEEEAAEATPVTQTTVPNPSPERRSRAAGVAN